MSALTVTDTLSVPEALAVVRDILAQTDGDAVLVALTERTVWPMGRLHQRFSRDGCVGLAGQDGDGWYWEVYPQAYAYSDMEPLYSRRGRGRAPTREAADAALCQALTALGWHCMAFEVPPLAEPQPVEPLSASDLRAAAFLSMSPAAFLRLTVEERNAARVMSALNAAGGVRR